jgi:hypothetical protein
LKINRFYISSGTARIEIEHGRLLVAGKKICKLGGAWKMLTKIAGRAGV